MYMYITFRDIERPQWLSGRVLDSRLRGCGFELHFIKYPIIHFLLSILELSVLLTFCLTAIKTTFLNIVKQFMRGMVKVYFGLLKNSARFLIN